MAKNFHLDNFKGDFLNICLFFLFLLHLQNSSRFSNILSQILSNSNKQYINRKSITLNFKKNDPYDWFYGPGSHINVCSVPWDQRREFVVFKTLFNKKELSLVNLYEKSVINRNLFLTFNQPSQITTGSYLSPHVRAQCCVCVCVFTGRRSCVTSDLCHQIQGFTVSLVNGCWSRVRSSGQFRALSVLLCRLKRARGAEAESRLGFYGDRPLVNSVFSSPCELKHIPRCANTRLYLSVRFTRQHTALLIWLILISGSWYLC